MDRGSRGGGPCGEESGRYPADLSDRIERSTDGGGPEGPPDRLQPGTMCQLGTECGRYQIVREIGRGGMAQVFLARRLGPAGWQRDVALKQIRVDLDIPRLPQMFLDEIRLASKLHHPGIAEALDLEQVGGSYILVLEYVDGVSVRQALKMARTQGVPLGEAFGCYVVASVAEALHYAHNVVADDGRVLGIVHRDVTPSNVMICRSGAVKLLDFGIAYSRLEGRHQTTAGAIRGTPNYLSPEQRMGLAVDGRSDLYSLTVLFVELLTGREINEETHEARTVTEIRERSATEVEGATRDLPEKLQALCRQALAWRVEDRPRNGAEYAKAIRQHMLETGIVYTADDCRYDLERRGAFCEKPEKVARARAAAKHGGSARSWRLAAAAGLVAVLSGPLPVTDPPVAPPASSPSMPPPPLKVPPAAIEVPPAAIEEEPPAPKVPRPAKKLFEVADHVNAFRVPYPESGQGILSVTAEPAGRVLLDGRPYGDTPKEFRLPAGAYSLQVIHPKLGKRQAIIHVQAGKRTRRTVGFW